MTDCHGVRIGALSFSPPLVLAPLADLSHAPFRELVAELGGCGLFYTEMLNARVVAAAGLAGDPYLAVSPLARPLVAQLVGNDPDRMARAAAMLQDAGFDGIDINMGCSRQRIVRFGWGMGLMADPEQALRVVAGVRRAVTLPLLAKIRSGTEKERGSLVGFARSLAAAGIDGLCLHPRSLEDGFKRPAKWSEIGTLVRDLSIPVIGNGDVLDREDHRRLVAESGCAAVMIGRGALIRPWLFRELRDGRPWEGEPGAVVERFAELLRQYLPAELHRSRFLLFFGWFSRNWTFHRQLQAEVSRCAGLDEMVARAVAGVKDGVGERVKRPFAGRL